MMRLSTTAIGAWSAYMVNIDYAAVVAGNQIAKNASWLIGHSAIVGVAIGLLVMGLAAGVES